MPAQLSSFSDSKTHYPVLDGLRGVAAVLLVLFHLLEPFSHADHTKQIMNHGYLAVDFFFVLSGFVIGYAYDDRWARMSLRGFFKRRLIRLHPMIIMGMTIGALLFYFADAPEVFPNIHDTPVWKLLLLMLIGYTMIPVSPALDIRGWYETYPLNGPAWSLFYEYVANILYALFFRRISNTILAVLVVMAGGALIQLAVTSPQGDLIGGWSLEPEQLRIGFTRLLYPFMAGLLLSRVSKPGRGRNAFWWCSAMVALAFAIPRVGGSDHLWWNGMYDSLVVIAWFPLLIRVGASGDAGTGLTSRLCRWLGDISYPLYITHFPLIYIFTAWMATNKVALQNAWPVIFGVWILAIALAYASLKLYDVPVRRWLTNKLKP